MPAFWPDYPKSFYPQFGNDAEAQIQAIRDHLLTFRGGPSPRGNTKTANNNVRAKSEDLRIAGRHWVGTVLNGFDPAFFHAS